MKKALVGFMVVMSLAIVGLAPMSARAYDPLNAACNTGSASDKSTICTQNNAQQLTDTNPVAGSNGLLSKVTNLIAIGAGIIGTIMVIVSGFQIITAGGGGSGDTNKIKKARGRLLAALIGMVIVALAWTIVTFVVQKFIK